MMCLNLESCLRRQCFISSGFRDLCSSLACRHALKSDIDCIRVQAYAIAKLLLILRRNLNHASKWVELIATR
jgi:hypothetical protein